MSEHPNKTLEQVMQNEQPREKPEPPPARRALIVFAAMGAVLELLYLLAWRPMARGFALDTPPEEYPFLCFFALWIASFALYFVAIRFARQAGRAAVVVPIIVVLALVYRLTLWLTPPILENDIYRYLWDGRAVANGVNPFRFAPKDVACFSAWPGIDMPGLRMPRDRICNLARAELAKLSNTPGLSVDDIGCLEELQRLSRRERRALAKLADLYDTDRYADLLREINYPEVPTIYPPFAQLAFGTAHAIAPMSIAAMTGVFITVDMVTVLLIVVLLRMLGRNPAWCVVYAWSPLVVKEIANSGHCDALAVCCAVLGVILVLRGRRILSGAALALGFLAKMFPLLLLPIAWKRIRRRGAIAFAVIAIAAYLPFVGFGPSRVVQGLGAYADRWEFNSGLFTLCEKNIVERIVHPPFPMIDIMISRGGHESLATTKEIDPFLVTKLIMGAAFLAVFVVVLRREERDDTDFVHKVFLVIAALLLLGPMANAWYFCWLLPFLCVFPRRSWLLLTCLLVFAYAYCLPNSAAADGWIWSTLIRPIASHIPFGPRGDAALWSALPEPERNLLLHRWWRTFGVRFLEYVPFYALLIIETLSAWRAQRQAPTGTVGMGSAREA